MHRPLSRGPRGSTLLEATVVLVMLGLLSAIAVPRFLSSRARAHQAEVRNNLNSWMHAQRSYFEEVGRYEQDLHALGFTIDRGNRYAYYFGLMPDPCEKRDTAEAVRPPPNPRRPLTCIEADRYVHGRNTAGRPPWFRRGGDDITHTGEGFAPGNPGPTNGPEGWSSVGNISAFAVGNIDDEVYGMDTWYISSADSRVSMKCGDSKEHLAAGTPINYYDDLEHDGIAGCF